MALRPDPSKSLADKRVQRDAAQQDVFMREVDDALREDEMRSLFQRYGKPVMAALVVGLLALAGYLWWDREHTKSIGENGEKLVQAIDQVEAANLADADKQLTALAANGDEANAVAAKLLRAGIALRQSRNADAVKLFAEVAKDEKAPEPYRNLALVREVATNFDKMDPQQVVDRLKPLAVPGNPWFGSAGELVGIAYLKQGKNNLAGPLFAQIAREKQAPDTLRRRARQMAGLLGVDAVEDPKTSAGDVQAGDVQAGGGQMAEGQGAEGQGPQGQPAQAQPAPGAPQPPPAPQPAPAAPSQ